MLKLPLALICLLLASAALAITPPWYYRTWSGTPGTLLPGDTLRTEVIDIGYCGSGILMQGSGYGSDSVSVLIESSLDGVNWATELSSYPLDWSAPPAAGFTTVKIPEWEISESGSFRYRSWGKYVRFTLSNEAVDDTLVGLGISVCASCR